MVQENTTFGVCYDQCGLSSLKNNNNSSSCVTHECLPLSMEEINEEKDEELKRQERRELIDYYMKRLKEKEAELKRREELIQNVKQKRKREVCVDAIEHLYYLIPTGKRSKRKRRPRYKTLKNENNKLKIVRKEKEYSVDKKTESTIQDFEFSRIIKIEYVQGCSKNIKKSVIITEPMEKIQERTPKIESFLKNEKIKKMVHNKKPNRVSQAVLPEEFKNKIQELGVPISEVSLVIEKPLYSTDLSKKHMRLSIPLNQVLNHDEFLTPREKWILDTKDRCNKWSQIKFNLIEPSLEECNIHLAKWPMNSSSSYVLLNDWMSVWKRNDLKVNMMVQLWSFRKDSNRWLALVVVPPVQ